MQRRSQSTNWESQLRSYEHYDSWPKRRNSSPDRAASPPQAPHMPQSSSSSFLEAYTKYVKRVKEDGRDSLGADPNSPSDAGPRIKAFKRGSTADEESPDTRKDTTDSSYTDWPASTSTTSHAVNTRNLSGSGDSVQTSATCLAAARLKQTADLRSSSWGKGSRSRSRTPDGQRGAVAAAVDALESRFRSSQEFSTPTKSHPLLSIPADDGSIEKLQTSSQPSSPWPHVQYEPSPRPEAGQPEILPAAGGSPAHRDGDPSAAAAEPGGDGMDAKLAAAFERQPGLREKLLHLLKEKQGTEADSLGLQVQELMKDHPDIVASLNAQFKLMTGEQQGLQQALLSSASMHLVKEGNSPRAGRKRLRKGPPKTYMVVMRGIDSSELTGLREELRRGEVHDRSWKGLAKWLVPPKHSHYFPWCTCLVISTCLCIFFFMAGGYSTFLQQEQGVQTAQEPYKPQQMGKWVRFSAGWRSFDFEYLLLWGGQYLPAIHEHQGWRWITAAFVHVSFMHLLGNMILFAVLGGMLEARYGPLRILLVLVISTLGAAFFAGAFADQCTQVVGASGAVLGFVGLTLADLVVNTGSLRSALLRLAIILAAAIFFIVTAAAKSGDFTSNWSHLGGFVCGLCPSFLFLPDFGDRRWRKAQQLAAKVAALGRTRRGEAEAGPRGPDGPGASLQRAEEGRRLELPGAAREGESPGERHDAAPVPGARPPEDPSPVASDSQPNLRLFTEEHSDGATLESGPLFRRLGCCSGCPIPRRTRWLSGSWNRAMLPCIILGAFVIIGVFTALPIYIYAGRLPGLQCTQP